MDIKDCGVCVMQSAETVLDVLRERGRRGLPCDELYRQLWVFELSRVLYPTRLRRVTGGGNAPATRP
jgi:hypothetical protein